MDLSYRRSERLARSVLREKREPQAGPASCLSNAASKEYDASGEGVICSETNTETTAKGEVVEGLVKVVGDGVDGGSVAGAGEGDVGEFSAAAFGEVVGAVAGGALGAVNREGVAVVEVFVVDLLTGEVDVTAVVGGEGEGLVVVVDVGDGAALAGDEVALVVGGEGDNLVPDGVGAAAGGPPPSAGWSRSGWVSLSSIATRNERPAWRRSSARRPWPSAAT